MADHTPALRAFTGLAGSAFAVIRKVKKQTPAKARTTRRGRQSLTLVGKISGNDDTLRAPSKHLETVEAFEPWIDEYGQKHGQIDLDCAFQEYQFDGELRTGTRPDSDESSEEINNRGGDARDLGSDSTAQTINVALQDLGVKSDAPQAGYRVGSIPGTLLRRPRKPTPNTWWIFEDDFLYAFIRDKYPKTDDLRNMQDARRAIIVLYEYFRKNLQDQEIFQLCLGGKTSGGLFENAQNVKNLRQHLVREGAKMYGQHKPSPRNGGHGTNCWCLDCKKRSGMTGWDDIRNGKDKPSISR